MDAVDSPQVELSIVMPCLNEAETLAICIKKARWFLDTYQVSGEVVIADNGSTDGSQEIAQQLGARVVHVPIKGYGAALMGGIVASHGTYVIMGDSDDSYDFTSLMPFVEALRAGNELVMGNRFWGGIKPGAMPPLHKYLGNPVLSSIGRLFFRTPIGDFHCGLRGFRRDAILSLDLRTTGMEYASEMVVKAALRGLKTAEVPTILYPDGRSCPPHLRTWSDGWRHLRFLLLYSPRWLFLYPGICLMIIGLLVGLWLLPGTRTIHNINLDVNTLFYAALAVIIGFQSASFAVFTKVFGISEGLLPDDPQLNAVLRYIDLEKGLIVGVLCILIGFIASVSALLYWQSRSFGSLDPVLSLRMVIPGGTLLALGFQIVLSSFFLSILGLKRR